METQSYDQGELITRAAQHPVAGPILEIIARDLIIEGLEAKLAKLQPEEEEKK